VLSGLEDGTFDYTITDIIGKKLAQCENSTATGKYLRNIDVSGFPRGAYILRLTSKQGFSTTNLFIKN
jgi:hypothetical protein